MLINLSITSIIQPVSNDHLIVSKCFPVSYSNVSFRVLKRNVTYGTHTHIKRIHSVGLHYIAGAVQLWLSDIKKVENLVVVRYTRLVSQQLQSGNEELKDSWRASGLQFLLKSQKAGSYSSKGISRGNNSIDEVVSKSKEQTRKKLKSFPLSMSFCADWYQKVPSTFRMGHPMPV